MTTNNTPQDSTLTISQNVFAVSKFLEKNDELAVLYTPEQLAIQVQGLENKILFHEEQATKLYIADRGCYFKVAEQAQKAEANQHAGRAFAYKEMLNDLFAGLDKEQRIEIEQIREKLLIQSAKNAIHKNYQARVDKIKASEGPVVLDIASIKIT